MFLILLNSFIVIVRSPIDNFINAYGLFADTWAPIAEMVINLSISLIFGKLWGISGIMLGTTISMLIIIMFWKTFYLFSQGFHMSVLKNFWFLFVKNVLAFITSYFVIIYILDNYISKITLNYLDLVLLTIKLNLVIVFIFIPILFLFSQGFRNFVYRFKKYIPFL